MDHDRHHRYLEAIDERVAKLGTTRKVYRDKREGPVRVDVYIVDIQVGGEPRILLLTAGCGLVERKQQRAVELAMVLPATWPIDDETALAQPQVFWPLAWLRYLGANVPQFWWGPLPCDLIRIAAEPNRPRATRFAGVLGAPGAWIAAALDDALAFEGRAISLTALIPLTDDEIEWAAERGEDGDAGDGSALLDPLETRAAQIITIDDARGSLIPS